jgi:hypothetical protein
MTATAPRPGVIVTTRTAPPPRAIPTAVGTWFVVGTTDRGPLQPVLVRSMQDFINNFGQRQAYSVLYDSLETYFRLGGVQAYVSRVVGPAALPAQVTLNDPAVAPSLVIKAKGPGAYGNSLRITVTVTGSTFQITVADSVLGTLEISPVFSDQQSAVNWSNLSNWINITLGSSANIPAAISAAALTGGTDDRVNITDAQWLTALNKFSRDLGPGQVSAPGRTTPTGKQQLRDHAAGYNRIALVDLVDSSTPVTLQSAVTSDLRGTNDQFVMAFAPWLIIPGLTPNTFRYVPPSPAVAARIAASDARGNSPNKPAAGNQLGILDWVVNLSQVAFDSGAGIGVTRDAMYDSGVNLIVYRYGNFEIFGWRTAVDPVGTNQDWINAGNARLNMAITARALAIAENYVLDEIDGQGRLFSRWQGDLTAMLTEYWNMGSLYGATPEDAFVVDVGPSVNTPASIQNREIHAQLGLRMSQDAELVYIEISKVPVSQSLAAA